MNPYRDDPTSKRRAHEHSEWMRREYAWVGPCVICGTRDHYEQPCVYWRLPWRSVASVLLDMVALR
jgi:hypothetical protein